MKGKTTGVITVTAAVDTEMKNLLQAGHIRRIEKITEGMFIQPEMINVKTDRSFEIISYPGRKRLPF